jgi:hypothetical protein
MQSLFQLIHLCSWLLTFQFCIFLLIFGNLLRLHVWHALTIYQEVKSSCALVKIYLCQFKEWFTYFIHLFTFNNQLKLIFIGINFPYIEAVHSSYIFICDYHKCLIIDQRFDICSFTSLLICMHLLVATSTAPISALRSPCCSRK